MTPEENRRRLSALRTKEGQRGEENRGDKEPLHNSAEALWIKRMNEGGEGQTKLHHPRPARVA